MVGRGKAVQVDPDLGYDDLGDRLPNARDRVEHLDGFRHERVGPGVPLLPDPLGYVLERRFHLVILVEQLA